MNLWNVAHSWHLFLYLLHYPFIRSVLYYDKTNYEVVPCQTI